MKRIKAHIKVIKAFLTNNRKGKKVDAIGRSYEYVYAFFGHQTMVNEYLCHNTWEVK